MMPPTTMYNQVYLWEYLVKAESVEEFERVYGSAGEWTVLFQRSAAYRGTMLLRDPIQPLRFVTIDCWESDLAYRRFKAEMTDEYAAIDRKSEALTVDERFLGGFTRTPDPSHPKES